MVQGLSRFCVFSFFRISLDSVLVSESVGLDSMLAFESALDSVDSLFLRVVFSRILSNFLESCVFSQKGVFPSPRSPQPRKSLHCFCCALLASLRHGNRGESLAFSASSAIVAEALLPPCPNDCTPRSGRGAVCADALHILFDFCVAKMAESKDSTSLDSARLVLAHALLLIFGKASIRFFEVIDSVKLFRF